MKCILFPLALVLALSAPAWAGDPVPEIPPGKAVPLDGNTLRIKGQTVRLVAIDAPKMNRHGGPQAHAKLDTLMIGDATCQGMGMDRENTPLARCTVAGHDLGEALLREGLAVVERKHAVGSEIAARYNTAEAEARVNGRGLWARTHVSDYGFAGNFVKDFQALFAGLIALAAALIAGGLTAYFLNRQAKAIMKGADKEAKATRDAGEAQSAAIRDSIDKQHVMAESLREHEREALKRILISEIGTLTEAVNARLRHLAFPSPEIDFDFVKNRPIQKPIAFPALVGKFGTIELTMINNVFLFFALYDLITENISIYGNNSAAKSQIHDDWKIFAKAAIKTITSLGGDPVRYGIDPDRIGEVMGPRPTKT
jgi:endonuclease YncB( thermonuclease family)